MLIRSGLLFFAAFSSLWAQAPAAARPRQAASRPANTAKRTATKPATAKAGAAKTEQAPSKIEPEALKVIQAVANRYRALASYSLEGAVDSGRQVDEEARQSMAKADVKLRVAPNGLYSLDVVEEGDNRPPYQVVSDGQRRWAYVADLKQYRETAALPSKTVSAADADPGNPLSGSETYAERLMRQLVPLLSNVDKTTDTAFLRGAVMTLLGKPDANGHGILLYLTLLNQEGEVGKVSWYQSDGPESKRMLVRTDFVITSLKELKPAPAATEFSFTPPPGVVLSSGATASAASSDQHPTSAQ